MLRNNELHLTPLCSIIQLRPNYTFLVALKRAYCCSRRLTLRDSMDYAVSECFLTWIPSSWRREPPRTPWWWVQKPTLPVQRACNRSLTLLTAALYCIITNYTGPIQCPWGVMYSAVVSPGRYHPSPYSVLLIMCMCAGCMFTCYTTINK